MSKKSMDFHGSINLDQKIIDQLESYLKERESYLAHRLSEISKDLTVLYSSSPSLIHKRPKLNEAVDEFCKVLREAKYEDKINLQVAFKHVLQEVNRVFWEFAEVLEGCVIELFQQVRTISIDRWNSSLHSVIQSIKDLLLRRLEDLMWLIKRLEKPMKEFIKNETKQSLWSKLMNSRKSCMDFHLLKNLENSDAYLKKEFDKFNLRYHEFLFLKGKVDEELKKTQYYPILSLLDIQQQDLYIQLMRLLKLMELNPHPKKEVGKETIRALKNLSSVDTMIQLFKVYHHELRASLFKSSLEWKSLSQEKELFEEAVARLKEKIKEDQDELETFLQVMSQYRRFILKNDSNPYVGSRWGFSEWIVGPEPAKSKQILTLIYQAEELRQLHMSFSLSLSQNSEEIADRKVVLEHEIEQILHEMGQPLISKSMIKKRAEELLEQLHRYDELGDPSMEAINFVEHTLSVALREDWKYHLLHDFPLFHQIYRLHLGIAGHKHDIAHSSRVNRFNHILNHIETWITKDEIYSHIHEIQMDMNDLKIYLQEFLASVQRSVKEKAQDPFFDETLHHFYQQLLECRYLFGGFFYMMMKESRDGQELRNQFLFVDQYFESIESLILESRFLYQDQSQDDE